MAPLVRVLGRGAVDGLVELVLGTRSHALQRGAQEEGSPLDAQSRARALLAEATLALCGLAQQHAEVEATLAAAVPGLVRVLAGGGSNDDVQLRATAAGALWSLSLVNDQIKVVMGQCGAIPQLVRLLGPNMSTARDEAVGTLWSLAMEPTLAPAVVAAGAVGAHLFALLAPAAAPLAATVEAAAGLVGACAACDASKLALLADGRVVAFLLRTLRARDRRGRDAAAVALSALARWDRGDVDGAWSAAAAPPWRSLLAEAAPSDVDQLRVSSTREPLTPTQQLLPGGATQTSSEVPTYRKPPMMHHASNRTTERCVYRPKLAPLGRYRLVQPSSTWCWRTRNTSRRQRRVAPRWRRWAWRRRRRREPMVLAA